MKDVLKIKPGALLPAGFEAEQRLKFNAVSKLTGMGRTKIYALLKAGKFPAPQRFGKRCSRWRAGDVIAFLNAGAA